jgi:hypothetical protein
MPETESGIQVKARFVKEAKNTVRYDIVEDVDRQAVGAVYVSKDCLPNPYPPEVTITIQ